MARSSLPPGFRFHPTDEELLVYYLKKKIAGRRVGEGVIGEIDIYKFEPADLPGLAILRSRDPEWFFFNAQDKKYLHGSRTNRTTKAGYWKATGKDRKISAGSCTGIKKTLIYYFGRAPHGERTDWVMHEFKLDEELEKKMNCIKSFVLCRVRRKGGLGPRNGEQYGAPVLEANKEDEGEGDLLTSYSPDEPCVLPSDFPQRVDLEETPSAATKGDVERTETTREDFVSFLQTVFPFEEEEQQPVQDGLPSVDDLLGLVDSQVEFAMNESTHAVPTYFLDLDSSGMDNLCTLLHPADNESVMLKDLLHLITGQVEAPDYQTGISNSLAFQEPSRNQASFDMDDLQNVGFLELADLEEPCHGDGLSLPLESNNFKGSNFGSDDGIEMTRLVQENLQLQSLQSFGYSESIRALPHLEAHGMLNEQLALEVLLDSSQGLSVVDSRLLTSDDGGGLLGDLPSGFVLSSGQEGVFANISPSSLEPSHSHSSGAYEQSEAQLTNLSGVNQDVQDAVSQEETRVAHGDDASINSRTIHSVPPREEPSSMVSLAPSPSSPSSLARVISGFLGKVNVLPASAADLPVELERCKPPMKESSISSAAESKTGHSALTSPSISGSSFHFKAKLNPLLDMERIARTPEMELQWSISHAVSVRDSAKPCKSFTNGLSMFLFWITTSALIFFCMFRDLCRSTRSAFL